MSSRGGIRSRAEAAALPNWIVPEPSVTRYASGANSNSCRYLSECELRLCDCFLLSGPLESHCARNPQIRG
jgi:hypothetical protein